MEKPIVMRGLSEDKAASGFTLFRVQPNKISEPIKNPVIALYFFDIAALDLYWKLNPFGNFKFKTGFIEYYPNKTGLSSWAFLCP